MSTKSYAIVSLIVAASVISGVAIALEVVRSRISITTVAGTVEPNRWRGLSQSPTTDLPRVLRRLELSEAQRIRVSSIVAQAKPQMQALYSAQRANEQALGAASPNDPAYPALLANEKSNAVAQIQMASDIKAQIYAVLTPEQTAKIPAIVAAAKAARDARVAAWRANHPQT